VAGVLCAGFGTRMAPITKVLPKPLIPFLNTPLITYALNHIARAGISRVGVNLHHLADAIPPVVDRLGAAFGIEPVYAREWEILGTAGGIRGIYDALGAPDATLVVLNGDSVMNLDLASIVAQHKQSGALATMVVRPRDVAQPGRVFLDAAGALTGIREWRKRGAVPDAHLIEHDFIGVHLIEPELLRTIPLEKGDILADAYIPAMESGGVVRAHVMDGFWAAIDNPTLYLDTQRRCLEDPELFHQAPLPEPLQEGVYVYLPDGIDDKAQLATPLFTGVNVDAAAGSRLGPNVVIDGAEIASGTVIRNAAVFGMGRIEGEWTDCLAIAGEVARS